MSYEYNKYLKDHRKGVLDAANWLLDNLPDTFKRIAEYWSVYKQAEFTAVDVAMMMGLLKIARIQGDRATKDSFIDLAGYAACGAEIVFSDKEES